jgi:hypothetical protein
LNPILLENVKVDCSGNAELGDVVEMVEVVVIADASAGSWPIVPPLLYELRRLVKRGMSKVLLTDVRKALSNVVKKPYTPARRS